MEKIDLFVWVTHIYEWRKHWSKILFFYCVALCYFLQEARNWWNIKRKKKTNMQEM